MATVAAWEAGALISPSQVAAPRSVNGFVYKATQAAAARTGSTEPNWPVVAGGTVVDGGVTWEAVTATAITWQAVALYKSGAVEPAWPTTPGATIVDGTITWRCRAPNVSDSKCPNTMQVRILGSKVYAISGDVTRFCATNNPLDWSSESDAGFLPHGLHASEEVDGKALGEYRGNLVILTATDFILWQVDPDPSLMAHLDTISGIGSTYARAHAAMAADFYMTTSQGVRSVGIAAASTNLQDSDIGTPIDSLVKAELLTSADPYAYFNTATGEWWLVMGRKIFVLQKSRVAKIEAWSRDELPFEAEETTSMDGTVYLRSGDTVYRLDSTVQSDAGTPFNSLVWWPHLDLGSPGVTKQLVGVDIVGRGSVTVSIGYDQNNSAAYTTPIPIGPDTEPGGIVPIPVSSPSLAVKLTWSGDWHMDRFALYVNEMRATA